MKTILDKLNEAYGGNGYEIAKYDLVSLDTAGFSIMGMVTNIEGEGDDETFTIKPFGWRGGDDVKDKIKKQYKVKAKSAKRIWKMDSTPEFIEQVKNKLL